MKTRFALATLAFSTFAVTTSLSTAIAEETLDGKAKITANRDAKSNKLEWTITGDGSGIYMNSEYNVKCKLTIKDGGKLGKAELTKSDAKYKEASGKPGKAETITFTTTADKPVEGECRVVVCTKESCSAPFTKKFSTK